MGEPSAGKPVNARVLETSGSGMRLHVALPVPCGADIVIEDRRLRILAETMRCDPQSGGYLVAVRVIRTGLLADVQPASTGDPHRELPAALPGADSSGAGS
jgi:hypothetical protein